MAFLLWHTVGSAKTHNDKEGSHVLPGRFRPMADDDYAASVPSEQAASDRLGPLELRHGAGPLVRPDGGESYAGQGDDAQGAAGTTHAWRREWLRLLRRLHRAIPRAWTVIVLADRGLHAPWLFRRITRLGWHPFLRINTAGSFRPAGATCWRPFLSLVLRPGTSWRGTGIAFTRNQVPCTLLARWEEGDKDPWLILTDLAPEASDAGWYGLRAWMEQGLKVTKRAGWQWHRTRMRDPDRAARLWLAVAVATLWLLSVGGEADETIPASTLLDVTAWCPAPPRTR